MAAGAFARGIGFGVSLPPALLPLAAHALWRTGPDLRIESVEPLAMEGSVLPSLLEGRRLTALLDEGLPGEEAAEVRRGLDEGEVLRDLVLGLGGGKYTLWLSGGPSGGRGRAAGYEGLARLLPQAPAGQRTEREIAYLSARLATSEANAGRLQAECGILLKCLSTLTRPTPLAVKCRALIAHFGELLPFDAAMILRYGVGGRLGILAATEDGLEGRTVSDHPGLAALLARDAVLLGTESAYGYLLADLPPRFAHYRSALAASVAIGQERAVLVVFNKAADAYSGYDFRLMRRLSVVATEALQTEEHRVAALNAAKLASLGEMVSGIAHEINQPLSVIGLMSANIRLRLGADVAPIAEKLETIDRQIERTGEIIRVIRNFVYPERGRPDLLPIAVEETLESVALLTRGLLARRAIALTLDMPEGIGSLMGHGLYLQQILVNLITNARDAIDGRRSRDGGDGLIVLTARREGEAVHLAVRDNGGGAPQAVVSRLFDAFFTLKEQGKGTGLGLPICRSLAEDMGGRIAFRNIEGGAEVTVTLKSA